MAPSVALQVRLDSMPLDLTIQGEACCRRPGILRRGRTSTSTTNLNYQNTLGMTSDTMPRTWVFTKTFSADFVGIRLDHPSSGLVRYGIESWVRGEQQQISDRT